MAATAARDASAAWRTFRFPRFGRINPAAACAYCMVRPRPVPTIEPRRVSGRPKPEARMTQDGSKVERTLSIVMSALVLLCGSAHAVDPATPPPPAHHGLASTLYINY